jgi:hypothetical protein
MRSIISLSLLLACTVASAAEVYKWKDKDGRVHYGDRPKQGAQSVIVTPSSGSGVPSEAEGNRQAREAECQTTRAKYEAYRRAPSISEIDNLGKQREYTPAEREQFLAMTERKVAELCNPPAAPASTAAAETPTETPSEAGSDTPPETPAEAPPAEEPTE